MKSIIDSNVDSFGGKITKVDSFGDIDSNARLKALQCDSSGEIKEVDSFGDKLVDSSNLIDSYGEKKVKPVSYKTSKYPKLPSKQVKRKEDSHTVKSVKERVNELESIESSKKDKKSIRGKCCFSPNKANKSDKKLDKKFVRRSNGQHNFWCIIGPVRADSLGGHICPPSRKIGWI